METDDYRLRTSGAPAAAAPERGGLMGPLREQMHEMFEEAIDSVRLSDRDKIRLYVEGLMRPPVLVWVPKKVSDEDLWSNEVTGR